MKFVAQIVPDDVRDKEDGLQYERPAGRFPKMPRGDPEEGICDDECHRAPFEGDLERAYDPVPHAY